MIEITVEHHRRYAPARVVALPFYDPEWKKQVVVASNTYDAIVIGAGHNGTDCRGVPGARRQEGRRARAARHRRRRGRHRRDLPGLPVLGVFVRRQPAAARDHPRPRIAAAWAQDPAVAEHRHAARQRRLPRRLGRSRPDAPRDLPSLAARRRSGGRIFAADGACGQGDQAGARHSCRRIRRRSAGATCAAC